MTQWYCIPAKPTCFDHNHVCRNSKDRSLHDLIASDILPKLVESAAARRRAEDKQAAIEAMPKKRSSRLQVCPCPHFHPFSTLHQHNRSHEPNGITYVHTVAACARQHLGYSLASCVSKLTQIPRSQSCFALQPLPKGVWVSAQKLRT